jgi:hypothetical protein
MHKRKAPDRQGALAGTERISDGDLTRRLAERKLTPRVEQKPPVGLFSDEKDQLDLVDLTRRTKP